MKTFQLDECINSKTLAKTCNSSGLAQVDRFPSDMVSNAVKDPAVLARFMTGSAALITTDNRMPRHHAADIPETNPGILIIKPDVGPNDLIKINNIIATFKAKVPDWYEISFANSIVRLSETTINISHVNGGVVIKDVEIRYADADWRAVMCATLKKNRAASIPSPSNSDELAPTEKATSD